MQIHINSKMAEQLGLSKTGKAIELYEVSLVSEQQVTANNQVNDLLGQIAALQTERSKLADEVMRLAGELEAAKAPPAPEEKQPETEPKKRGK